MKDMFHAVLKDIIMSEYKSINTIIKELSAEEDLENGISGDGLSYKDVTQDMDFDNLPDAILEDFIEKGSHVVIYGESNSGKTFLTLDIAAHIAVGKDWGGFKYKGDPGGCGVLYLCAEAGKKFKVREAVVKRKLGLDLHDKMEDWKFFRVDNKVIQIDKNGEVRKGILDIINHLKEEHNIEIGVVVIDTLARSFVGDENNTETMNSYIKEIDEVKTQTDATVILVHHTGKDKTKGARGSSSLRAAIDTEIEVINDNGIRQMRVTKQRDFEIPEPQGFKILADNYKIHDSKMFDQEYPCGALYKSARVELCELDKPVIENDHQTSSVILNNDPIESFSEADFDYACEGLNISFEDFIEEFSLDFSQLNDNSVSDLIVKYFSQFENDEDFMKNEELLRKLSEKYGKKIGKIMREKSFSLGQKQIKGVRKKVFTYKDVE